MPSYPAMLRITLCTQESIPASSGTIWMLNIESRSAVCKKNTLSAGLLFWPHGPYLKKVTRDPAQNREGNGYYWVP